MLFENAAHNPTGAYVTCRLAFLPEFLFFLISNAVTWQGLWSHVATVQWNFSKQISLSCFSLSRLMCVCVFLSKCTYTTYIGSLWRAGEVPGPWNAGCERPDVGSGVLLTAERLSTAHLSIELAVNHCCAGWVQSLSMISLPLSLLYIPRNFLKRSASPLNLLMFSFFFHNVQGSWLMTAIATKISVEMIFFFKVFYFLQCPGVLLSSQPTCLLHWLGLLYG